VIRVFKGFFEELLNGKLIGLRCLDCNTIVCPPKSTCDNCKGRNFERVELSGRGKIMSYTVTYVAPLGYTEEVPYVVALVELEEGPWILGRLDVDPDVADSEDLIGKRVEVYGIELPSEMFYPIKEKRIVPMFKIVTEDSRC
jgi:uncharacterized OB-fold protein